MSEKKVLTNDTPQKIKEGIKKEVIKDNELSKEQEEIIAKCWEEAKMPVEMTDKDFKLGENELDIRKLGEKNFAQMIFRQLVLNTVYQRQISQSLVDLMRLVMIILQKLGVEDIIKATDDLLTELQKKVNETTKKA